MWIYKTRDPANSEKATVVSILSPDEVSALGEIPAEAIAGSFEGNAVTQEAFRANRVFIDFLHEVIGKAGLSDPSLIAAARQQRDGWMYLIDLRTPDGPRGSVPPEDIIGAFEVRSGELLPGSYQPGGSHRILSKHGLVKLPPILREAFVSELLRRNGSTAARAES